ncbi:MAG: hypothetical protein IPN95_11885 [Bacteroidetes bacterium]|nr:hypothetical protein [Bacteroidota bacterium]
MVLTEDGNQLQFENVITGLHSGSVNDMAIFDGSLVLAAEEGLILLNPNEKAVSVQPQVCITKLEISGKSYAPDALVEVDYLENDVKIDYSILNFRTGGDYPFFTGSTAGCGTPQMPIRAN